MNKKDFYNLVDVYMDAVFFPRAASDPQVLQQEGWHLELDDPSQPLQYKGVVFNEMKGVYSSPDALMGRAIQSALFPDNAYSVDSGGDPRAIPQLTFEEFKKFHATSYHPSNARTFFYGDDDPRTRLDMVDQYFKEFTAMPVQSTAVTLQPKKPLWRGIKDRLKVPHPAAAPDEGGEDHRIITVNWLLNDQPLSSKEKLTLAILNHLMLGTSTAALQKALTDSRLGESVVGGGVDDDLAQATFSVGMRGVREDNVEAVEELVLKTLTDLASSGFEESAVRASLNSVEFHLREFNTGGFPKGLSLMLGCLSEWIYDRDPLNGIRFEEPLAELKKDLAEGKPVFQDLIRRLLLQNEHRVAVEMVPDPSLEQAQLDEEAKALADIKAGLSEEEIEGVMRDTKLLREAQAAEDSPEAKATLPRLTVEDIDPHPKEIPTESRALSCGSTVLEHPISSSGILYTDIGIKFTGVPEKDLNLLPLFTRMLMETGTESMDDVALSRLIGAETGGIRASWYSDLKSSPGHVCNPEDVLYYFMMRGKCTTEKIPIMFDIMTDLLLNAQLHNKKRALDMLLEAKARRVNSVVANGHSFAMTRLSSRYSFLGYMAEHTSGLTYLRSLDALIDEVENDWPSVQARLENIRNTILSTPRSQDGVVINLTGDRPTLENSRPSVDAFVKSVNDAAVGLENKGTASQSCADLVRIWKDTKGADTTDREGFTMTSQVNYVIKGGPMLQPGEPVSGSFSVVSRYLSNGYLWDHVRVMGGAYGGFGRFSGQSGRFVFASYRDPNILKTLNVYDDAAVVLSGEDVSADDILQSIIGCIGDLDSPMSVDQKGFTAMARHISGETAEERAKWRQEILATSGDDFKLFAEKLKLVVDNGGVVVFGSKAALEEANEQIDPPKRLRLAPAFISHR
eukprot:CAMPEP_0185037566 /NCGR_PEP_ID=MMETSP1103-20130426/32208_1 /TAXON_ID=36769 /ORGANISM="Paraphysomonas bandaiensis, Strain Caron Lab Isolate" /LENGTH=907 /DNA_ID=CAMNT_0027575611 /DNA_START=503 /DNA_END=3226 /DNA_ORIENTATION=+